MALLIGELNYKFQLFFCVQHLEICFQQCSYVCLDAEQVTCFKDIHRIIWLEGSKHTWAIKIFLRKQSRLSMTAGQNNIQQELSAMWPWSSRLWICWCAVFHCHVQQLLSHLPRFYPESRPCSHYPCEPGQRCFAVRFRTSIWGL